MMGNAIKNTGWGKSTTFLAWFVESVQVLQLNKIKLNVVNFSPGEHNIIQV